LEDEDKFAIHFELDEIPVKFHLLFSVFYIWNYLWIWQNIIVLM